MTVILIFNPPHLQSVKVLLLTAATERPKPVVHLFEFELLTRIE